MDRHQRNKFLNDLQRLSSEYNENLYDNGAPEGLQPGDILIALNESRQLGEVLRWNGEMITVKLIPQNLDVIIARKEWRKADPQDIVRVRNANRARKKAV